MEYATTVRPGRHAAGSRPSVLTFTHLLALLQYSTVQYRSTFDSGRLTAVRPELL